MKYSRYFLLLILTVKAVVALPQDSISSTVIFPAYDSLQILYPFLNTGANHLSGDTSSLTPFYEKLGRIEKGSCEQAVIVHIGDSHVQPGVMSQPLREWVQLTFVDAGKGMMFPYRLAKSNGPAGYISHCDTPWVYGRNATMRRPLPTGIAGFTLWSKKPAASFTVEFTSPPLPAGDSARLVIFHAGRDSSFVFRVNSETDGHCYRVADSLHPFRTVYIIDDNMSKIRIKAIKTDSLQKSATFYGMSLEHSRPGVIVHTIGVNGAMFSSYLESEHFTDQLASLHPDLLIFSLGTNEAFSTKTYSDDEFSTVLDSLFLKFRQKGINAPAILATPPGIYKRSGKRRKATYKPNPVAEEVATVLKNYSAANHMAVWDWYTIMGGKEAMAKWKAKKMTDKRFVHFSGKGYAIQGTLLREAVRGGYEQWKKINK